MQISAPLSAMLPAAWDRVTALSGATAQQNLKRALKERSLLQESEQLLVISPFFTEQLAHHAKWVTEHTDNDWLANRDWTRDRWLNHARNVIDSSLNDSDFMSALRRFRNREYLRVVWRDFSRKAHLEDTLNDVTALADTTIHLALERAEIKFKARFGTPIGARTGTTQELVVLGLGKLGGCELNLSSDIDLCFTYLESGNTEGGHTSISNQEYFIKVGQALIRYLDTLTADGFVFRVDMRLRPYGDSGALVSSHNALKLYYQDSGQGWERYAMMKARPITGSTTSTKPLIKMIQAFVYRSYIDFSVLNSLRNMKAMTIAEIRRQGLSDDIKRGTGGIREIEFIAQCIQLIHGGRNTDLQVRGLIKSLKALREHNLYPPDSINELIDAYRWLRNLEHGIQGMEDRQTQTLPTDKLSQDRLAAIMRQPDWATLVITLNRYRTKVEDHFNALITPIGTNKQVAEPTSSFADLSVKTLRKLGFKDLEVSWGELKAFIDSSRMQRLLEENRQRVERFLPRLCEAAGNSAKPDLTLTRLLPFVIATCQRSAYLVLLEENPSALVQLIDLVQKSAWIAEKLAARPDLLEELLDADRLTTAPDRADIQALVRQQLLSVPEDSEDHLGAQMKALGHIKDAVVLRVASSELTGRLPTMKVSDYLTLLAEVILEQVIAMARAELINRYGEPQGPCTGFAVLGYGKLGGIELSYDSDLDLVFVYEGGEGETTGPKVIDNIRFYSRLAQRVVHVLSTKVSGGRLYEVDLRLRPHGESGLVVVSLPGLSKYQLESAWTWEHQALVRTRTVSGDKSFVEHLATLRAEILCKNRDKIQLRTDVINMRRKMIANAEEKSHLPTRKGWFNLKQSPGGIIDIEFIVQYLVLANAHTWRELIKWPDVVRILEVLQQTDVFPVSQANALKAAYLTYRSAVHVAALRGEKAEGRVDEYRTHLEQVSAIREQWLPSVLE